MDATEISWQALEVDRPQYIDRISRAFQVTPVVCLLGPRQCGKTTLAGQYGNTFKEPVHHFDLENPVDLARLENPVLALQGLTGLIIIDEVQRSPELFSVLRVIIDKKLPQKFLILGSASRDLLKQSSETLAGRLTYLELTPFSLEELNDWSKHQAHWLRGGFPLSFLAHNEELSFSWRESYISTFLERDIPALGIAVPSLQLRRFWMMITHYHGQIVNFSDLGRSLNISDTTARSYLDILSGTFMIRELSPWFENIGKRQIKRPKLYFRDAGIFHSLLGISSFNALQSHPRLGTSWEGYALEEVIRSENARSEECFFWGIHGQAELDLLIVKDGKRSGYEFKYQDAPRLTGSLQKSQELLELESLTVVYPGSTDYALTESISVRGLRGIMMRNVSFPSD